MSYFKYFPRVSDYQFGNEKSKTAFQNLSVYVDIIDQIKDNISFYRKYTIIDGERPDHVSTKLYGDPKYYWTFFLLNDHLRESGWPLPNRLLTEEIARRYPNTTITTRELFADKFKVGQIISGVTSGATGTIIRRRLDFGQIIVTAVPDSFVDGEIIQSEVGTTIETLSTFSAEREYNSIDHWEDVDGNWIDVDPTIGTSSIYTPITKYDKLVESNENLREIKVLKPTALSTVYSTFIQSLGT